MFFAAESDQPQGEWARGVAEWVGDVYSAVAADWLRVLLVGAFAITFYYAMLSRSKSKLASLITGFGAGVFGWWVIGLFMDDDTSTSPGVGRVSWLWRVWTDIGYLAGVAIVLAAFAVYMYLGRSSSQLVRISMGAAIYVALSFVAMKIENPVRNFVAETQESSIGNAGVQTARPDVVYAVGPGSPR